MSQPLAGKKVLCVNDELAPVMARHVDAMGGKGIPFRSLAKARQYVVSNADEIDCAVIDLLMGDGNGAEWLRELELVHHIPCVLVSGVDLETVSRESLRGIFLGKPFSAEELAAKILEAIGASEREKRG